MKKQLTLAGLILLFGLLDAAFGAQHAFIWDEANGMRDLGSLGGDSSAVGINDSGTVVGWYVKGSGYRGFIWTEAGGMVDLGIPGGVGGERATVFPPQLIRPETWLLMDARRMENKSPSSGPSPMGSPLFRRILRR